MFKKTLIVAALFSLTGAAYAGTITQANQTVGAEGLALATTPLSPFTSAIYAAAANYNNGDVVTFTLTGADFDKGAGWVPTMAYVSGGSISTLTVQPLVDSNPKVLRFRVANAGTDTTTGASWAIDGLQYAPSSMAAGSLVNLSVKVTDTSGALNIDNANPAPTSYTLKVINQFTGLANAVAPSFSGIVDVNQNRKGLTDGASSPTSSTADGINASYINNFGSITYNRVTLASTDWTLHGDFSALDANGDGVWNAADNTTIKTGGSVQGYNCSTGSGGTPVAFYALAADFQSVTINTAGSTTLSGLCFDFDAGTGAAAVPLPPQSFTLDAVANYTCGTGTENIYTGIAAGAWALNGSSIVIPYMPYGNSISQIIYVNNSSTVDGAINLSYIWQDGSTGSATLSSVATGGTITKLAGDVKAVLDAAGLTSGKAELTLTVNAPAAKVRAYTAYNVNTTGGNGNRVTVPNSSVDSGSGL